jgi:hypothetical protein
MPGVRAGVGSMNTPLDYESRRHDKPARGTPEDVAVCLKDAHCKTFVVSGLSWVTVAIACAICVMELKDALSGSAPITDEALADAERMYRQQEAVNGRRGRRFFELTLGLSSRRGTLTEAEIVQHLGTADLVYSAPGLRSKGLVYFYSNWLDRPDERNRLVMATLQNGVLVDFGYTGRRRANLREWHPPTEAESAETCEATGR